MKQGHINLWLLNVLVELVALRGKKDENVNDNKAALKNAIPLDYNIRLLRMNVDSVNVDKNVLLTKQ